MEAADFLGNVATNVAADWTQALIAPIGIVGWKACRGAWEKRPRGVRDALRLTIKSRWWRSSKTWAAVALYPMVFLPYAIASTIWFSPLLIVASGPMAKSILGSDEDVQSWIAIAFFMLCMTPVALITFERLFMRENPLHEALNLYIDGIAVWLLILAGCAICTVAFLPFALLCRILGVPINEGLMMAPQLIFVCACLVVFFGTYWLGCLFIAKGRLMPQVRNLFQYLTTLFRRRTVRAHAPLDGE